jgi:hypothetical protein
MSEDKIFEEIFGDTKDNVISGLDKICEDRDTAIEFIRVLRQKIRMMGIDIPLDPFGGR